MRHGGVAAALACVQAALMLMAFPAIAQTVVKVGLINSYSGFVAEAADQAQKAIDLYLKEHERDLPPGVRIELIRPVKRIQPAKVIMRERASCI